MSARRCASAPPTSPHSRPRCSCRPHGANRASPNVLRDAADATRVLGVTQVALVRYRWPGNVRELQNVIERIAVELAEEVDESDPAAACGALDPDALQAIAPELFAAPADTADSDDAQTLHARAAVARRPTRSARCSTHAAATATARAMLGISKTTLWRKLSVK